MKNVIFDKNYNSSGIEYFPEVPINNLNSFKYQENDETINFILINAENERISLLLNEKIVELDFLKIKYEFLINNITENENYDVNIEKILKENESLKNIIKEYKEKIEKEKKEKDNIMKNIKEKEKTFLKYNENFQNIMLDFKEKIEKLPELENKCFELESERNEIYLHLEEKLKENRLFSQKNFLLQNEIQNIDLLSKF